MKQLVKVEKREVLASSLNIAKKFGKQHAKVTLKCEALINDLSKIKGAKSGTLNFVKSKENYRGQEFVIYLMNREAFSLLVMSFTGKKALEWKIKFNSAFYDMEKALLQEGMNTNSLVWKEQRQQGVLARREETDIIKTFVDYATKQGSTKAKFYYKHITVATYKCLQLVEFKRPKLRDTLNHLQLSQLFIAENIASKSLEEYMEAGEHYKTIFTLIKNDLEAFASTLKLKNKENLK